MILPIANQAVKLYRPNELTFSEQLAARCKPTKLDFCLPSRCDDTLSFQVDISAITFSPKFLSLSILDEDDNVVYSDGALNHITMNLGETRAWVEFSWRDVLGNPDPYTGCDVGCYSIMIDEFDSNQSFLSEANQEFTAGNTWDVSDTKWSISGGQLLYDAAGPGAGGRNTSVITEFPMQGGYVYEVTFDIDSNTLSGSETMQAIITNPILAQAMDLTSLGAGTHTFTIDMSAAPTPRNTLQITGTDPAAENGTFVLNSVNIQLIADPSKALRSECFSLQDNETLQDDCTLYLKYSNDENAFGLDFEGFDGSPYAKFYQYLRIPAKLGKPKYNKDRELFIDSSEMGILLYSNTNKEYTITTDIMPEYAHDALSLALEHDTLLITDITRNSNDIQYVSTSDDYDPDWLDETDLLGAVEVTVIEEQIANKLENDNC